MNPERDFSSKPKILVVEDETITAHHVQRVLLRLGYEVTGVAASGSSALNLIAETTPDLLLADVGLEGEIDGIEVANRAREHWRTPTVFLTAYSDPETMRRARVTEPYGYLVKPFAEQELHATIEIALQQKRIAIDRDLEVAATAHILGRTQEELNAVTARLFSAEDQERERIARDLHDDINQRLALLQMNLEGIRRQLPLGIQESARAEISSVMKQVEDLSRDLRSLSHRLHPQILNDLGLERALQDLCESYEERYSSTVQFSTRNIPEHIPAPISVALYRIVQEAMQNIAKHSQAKLINIALIGGTASLELTLRDNGVGFDTQKRRPGTGIGLISMAQRAKLMGGSFQIQSHPGRGTRIHVSVPLTGDDLQDAAVVTANTVKSE